jgi:hypothetical protein
MVGIEKKAHVLVIASAALLFACSDIDSSEEEELLESEATGQPIVNGKPASEYTEAALINGQGYICSGAIIAPRVALTAGHCVSGSQFNIVAPYVNKSAKGTKKWTTYVPTGSYVNPNTLDVAVIVLDTPITLPSYPPLASSKVPLGTSAVNVGRINNGQASYSQLFYGKPVQLSDAPGFPLAYGSESVIQSGDSGGPVYVGSGANRTIVAVNSGAGGGRQILARVDLAYDEIQRIIDENGGSGGSSSSSSSGGSSGGAGCTASESEPNDESTAPNPLGAKTCGALSTGDDVDWFSWEVNAAGVAYDVSLYAAGDADILMWKNSGNGWSRIQNTSPTHFAATSNGAGRYLVAVRSSGEKAQSYTLSLKR